MTEVTLRSIQDAARAIAGRIHRTPLLASRTLSEMTRHRLYLKPENLQKTGCFKPRGALNKIARMPAAERARGVMAASAGNHAQGLAYAASALSIPVKVVMPATAPAAKVDATRAMGAEVVLHGNGFDEALAFSLELQKRTGMAYVHPCCDADVVSGAGTIGLEILVDLPDVDAIVIPIGGGGLISGISVAVKSQRPAVRIFGVQPAGAPSMKRAMEAGHVVVLESARSIADGMTGRAGFEDTLKYVKRYVEDVLLVSDTSLLGAISLLLTRCKLLAEGAGAGPLAAILDGALPLPPGSKVVALISGGNQDLGLLARWLTEGLDAGGGA
ncbi:MAG TPA: threonine/serine dehydratase [Candidatus Polarisedimenticolia bacterium]|jgi:threonine dehydratase